MFTFSILLNNFEEDFWFLLTSHTPSTQTVSTQDIKVSIKLCANLSAVSLAVGWFEFLFKMDTLLNTANLYRVLDNMLLNHNKIINHTRSRL